MIKKKIRTVRMRAPAKGFANAHEKSDIPNIKKTAPMRIRAVHGIVIVKSGFNINLLIIYLSVSSSS